MTTLTEQDKTVLLAEKVLQRTCKKHFDDVILTDENGQIVQYFNPYQDWNHTHMVLDMVMEDKNLQHKFIISMVGSAEYANEGFWIAIQATKEQLMDAVLSLIQS